MKGFRIAIVVGAIAAAMAIGPSAKADSLDKMTYLTFSQPVELPGNVTLPAGTYAFVVLKDFTYRHIVRVFDKDRTHVYATILAINDYRLQPTEKTVTRFSEVAEGAPNAIKEWFYPGDNFGQEFVYPRERAAALAQASHEAVPSMPEEVAAETTEPVTSPAEPAAKQMEEAPVKAELPTGRETEVAEAFETAPPAAELPKTASNLPLIGLSGLLLVMAGTMLWGFAKRSA